MHVTPTYQPAEVSADLVRLLQDKNGVCHVDERLSSGASSGEGARSLLGALLFIYASGIHVPCRCTEGVHAVNSDIL